MTAPSRQPVRVRKIRAMGQGTICRCERRCGTRYRAFYANVGLGTFATEREAEAVIAKAAERRRSFAHVDYNDLAELLMDLKPALKRDGLRRRWERHEMLMGRTG